MEGSGSGCEREANPVFSQNKLSHDFFGPFFIGKKDKWRTEKQLLKTIDLVSSKSWIFRPKNFGAIHDCAKPNYGWL
jgi:hypothetical protein